jgi:hypothetical protein
MRDSSSWTEWNSSANVRPPDPERLAFPTRRPKEAPGAQLYSGGRDSGRHLAQGRALGPGPGRPPAPQSDRTALSQVAVPSSASYIERRPRREPPFPEVLSALGGGSVVPVPIPHDCQGRVHSGLLASARGLLGSRCPSGDVHFRGDQPAAGRGGAPAAGGGSPDGGMASPVRAFARSGRTRPGLPPHRSRPSALSRMKGNGARVSGPLACAAVNCAMGPRIA